jgi:hypothetical protein
MNTASSSDFYIPFQVQTKDLKEQFEAVNKFVCSRGGWVTSIPGAPEVTMECLPGSSLPDELRRQGYTVKENGEGERIMSHGVPSGHTGIGRVLRFSFRLR